MLELVPIPISTEQLRL